MKVNSVVKVYDRYRFAIPLKGKVIKFANENDGVEVELLQTNNPHYPVGAKIWTHQWQLRMVKP